MSRYWADLVRPCPAHQEGKLRRRGNGRRFRAGSQPLLAREPNRRLDLPVGDGRGGGPPRRPPRTKSKGKPWFSLFLLAIVLLASAAGGYIYYRGSASLPQTEGELRLPGLAAPVEVLRDPNGVPHIYASSLEDLARATGFVHAQDRYFQMELIRRLGTGRMADLFGAELVPMDREVRLLGLHHAAQVELGSMDPFVRGLLELYAEGVNTYRETHLDHLPPEFQILELVPEPWQASDSLAIGKWMSHILSYNGSVEILRAHLSDKIGVDAAYALTGLEPPPTEEAALIPKHLPSRTALNHFKTSRGASNAWVVSGTRSATGGPLLASDPHLPLPIPSLWYEIHLVGGGLNVTGATLPGIPYVLIGHNERIAWGITASFADVQDHYVEFLNPENSRQYASGEQWMEFETFNENITVAGGDPVTVEVLRTHHGVVVSDEPREGKVLALRWDGLWNGDNALAFLRLNQANNWFEFSEALRSLGNVPLAFVYADVDGNIGWFPSGDIPVRIGFDGSVPTDGATGAFEWQNYIPHEAKPFYFNPEEGFIVSANHKVVADDAEYPLGRDQLAPFRAERINTLLATAGQVRVIDLLQIQNDRYDRSTEPVLRHLMSINPGEAEVAQAHDLLRTWNGQMSDGGAPALYQACYIKLIENTFQDELGEELYLELLEFLELGFPGGLYSVIDDPSSAWWDDRSTPAVEDRNTIFARSLNEAVAMLTELQGADPEAWDWAQLHGVEFEHPLGKQTPLNWVFNRGPAPFGGSGFTIANARVSLAEPFKTVAGTSFRMVVDLNRPDESMAVLPTGASGHPLSSHFFDQNQDWLKGQAHPMLFDRGRIEASLEGKLVLTP